jgi:hypothetical protein
MTVVCGGADSRAKPGTASVVVFTTTALASFLNNRGMGWAYLVAPFLGTLTFNMESFCEGDPPAEPTLTGEDILYIINPFINGAAAIVARQKFVQLVQHHLWYQACECVGVATPAAPAPTPKPTDAPDVRGNTNGCWEWSSGLRQPQQKASGNPYIVLIGTDEAATPAGQLPTSTAARAVAMPQVGPFRVLTRASLQGNAHERINVNIGWFGGSPVGTLFSIYSGPSVGGDLAYTEAVETVEPPSWATHWRVTLSSLGTVTTDYGEVELTGFCGGTPTDRIDPTCCTLDPAAMTLLNSIYQLLQLVQRQHVPFAYLQGTGSSGTSATGELEIPTSVGVAVELTTVPAWYGSAEGTPDRRFDLGWIALGTDDGLWLEPKRIESASQVFRSPAYITKVGYTFGPGVVATITPLLRES